MKAIVLDKIGNYQNLFVGSVEKPKPSSGEALVRIKAAALNHRDLWITQGLYAHIKLPVVLGSDGCGVVESVGPDTDGSWVGKEVVINPSMHWGPDPRAQGKDFRILGMPDNGTLAEYVKVPLDSLFEKPAHLTPQEAAAMPLGGLTAYRALFVQGRLKTNECVLITGIGGGVAALALRMARAINANILVTSGHDAKIQHAIQSRAAGGVNYKKPEWTKELSTLAQNLNGIDLVIDGAGGKGFGQLINMVKPGGRIVTYGATTGNPENLDLRRMFWKQITIQGSTMGTTEDFAAMLKFVETYHIKPTISNTFPIDHFHKAFEKMAKGEQLGKIVLQVSSR